MNIGKSSQLGKHGFDVCKKNAGILFRFPHLFPYLNGYRRSSATIFRVDVNIYVLFIAKRVVGHYVELVSIKIQ